MPIFQNSSQADLIHHESQTVPMVDSLYLDIVDNSPDLICRFSPQRHIIFVNATYCHFIGKKLAELIGQDFVHTIPGLDEELVINHLDALSVENPVGLLETPVVSATGETHWLQWISKAIFDKQARLVEFQSTGRDVSQQKQTELALKESEQRYKYLTQSVTDYIYSVEVDHDRLVFTTYDPNCVSVTGFSVEEFQANPYLWLDITVLEDRDEVLRELNRVITGKLTGQVDHRITHKNGSVRWVRNTIVTRYDENSDAVAYDGLIMVVTQRKLVELEQERLLASERQQRLLAETLGEIFLALTAKIGHQAVLGEILYQAYRLVPYNAADIIMLEDDTLRIARWWGYETYGAEEAIVKLAQKLEDFPLDTQVIQQRQPLVIPDTQLNPDWVVMPGLEWIKSSISVPICLHHQVLGLLRLNSETPYTFSVADVDFLQPLSNAAAIALENARLYDQVHQELAERKQAEREASELNQKLFTLQFASATIATNLDLQYVLEALTREITSLLGSEGCYISRWNRRKDTIPVIATYGMSHQLPNTDYKVADYPVTQQVLQEGYAQQMIISQPDIDPAERDFMQQFQFKTLLMLPMEFQEQVVGLVEVVDSREERVFTLQDIALTQLLANQAAIAMENARLYQQAQQEIREREQAENELRRVAARTQSILDAIPDSIFYLSRRGELLDHKANENLPEVLGKPIGGNHLNDIFPSETVDTFIHYIKQTLDTKLMHVFEYEVPTSLGKQTLEVRLVTAGPNEVLAIMGNITQRKRAQQQAIRTERLAALGHLSAALAHEINNPLQAMWSHLELVLKYPLDEAEKETHLQIVHKQIERLDSITRRVPQQQVPVIDLLHQVLTLTAKRLEQNYIQLTTEVQDDTLSVLVVPDQLIQVFLNLIINTIDAITISDTREGQLNIAIYTEGDHIAISFTNTGSVIPADILPHIFEPFFTTKPEGNGMGLWISHSLVQQCNGTLSVENLSDNRGVIFTVRLPAA
jgi:PAS domain S-box-containing protein